MRSRIMSNFPLIACCRQYAAGLVDYDGAYRHIAMHRRHSGLIEGQSH